MSDIMKPLSFEYLVDLCLGDYYSKGKIFEIDKNDFYVDLSGKLAAQFNREYLRFPAGPAAGPHTQLAQNIMSAYLTGARFFELKTVQIIDGEDMRKMIEKPCIDVRNAGYNVEWSTELTVREAADEYIKSSVMLQAMAVELGLSDIKDFVFNISVGYNLEGIRSKKISDFIDNMKDAKNTEMFNECLDVLRRSIKKFKKFKENDIEKISSGISNTVTLSTMHGCRADEILDIARYLIENKKINTFVKCNPTLLGYDNVRSILDGLGYNDVAIRKEDFEHDLKFDAAVEIVEELKRLGRENGVNTGIKLTNTLPVCNSKGILPGESMYMSGKPLYPIAAGVAGMFAERFGRDIHVSMSGGIDKNNVLDVLKAGIYPVTTATLLLKPGGYKNMKGLMDIISEGHIKYGELNPEAIKELCEKSKNDSNYKNRGEGRQIDDTLPVFNCFKTNCGICVDVCPNRANMRVYDDRFGSAHQIIHIESRCNECGNCHTFCTRGGFPYLKKVTLFADKVEYENSGNPGILKLGTGKFMLRDENKNEWVYEPDGDETAAEKSEIEMILEKLAAEYPYLLK